MPSIVLITSRQDKLLLPWLDLYETAFPCAERVPVSLLLAALPTWSADASPEPMGRPHMLAALDEEDAFAGLAFYTDQLAGGRLAFLWYLATLPELRGQGLGAWIYRGILARLARGVDALLFDVEIPERAANPQERELAARRVHFYRRLGARRLSGVEYLLQAGPARPAVPMHLFAHPLAPIEAQDCFDLGRQWLGDSLRVLGPPGWD